MEGHFKEKSAMRLRKVTKIQEIRPWPSLTEENSLLLRADLKVHPEGHLLATVSKSAKGFNGGKKISFGALQQQKIPT